MPSKKPNPAYFNDTPPQKWSFLDYLNSCSIDDHASNVYRWGRALDSLRDDPDPDRSKAAHRLLKTQHEVPRIARNWYSTAKGNGKLHGPRKSKASVIVKRTTNVTGSFATVNTGDNAVFYQHQRISRALSPLGSVSSGIIHHPSKPRSSSAPPAGGTNQVNVTGLYTTVNTGDNAEFHQNQHLEEISTPLSHEPPSESGEPPIPPIGGGDSPAASLPASLNSFQFSSTGRSLREIISKSQLPVKNLAHEGVIDLADEDVMALLDKKERQELNTSVPPIPDPDCTFMNSAGRFKATKSAQDFRNVVDNDPYRAQDVEYDHKKHADAEWVDICIRAMLRLFASYQDLEALSPREGWLDSNLWAHFIDACAAGHPQLFFQRKEIRSTAIKWREEVLNVHSSKANANSKLDSVIHTPRGHPRLEFGAIEVASDFTNTGSSKWLGDANKLIMALHSMAGRIGDLVNHDEDVLQEVQLVAFIHAGFHFQIFTLHPISPSESVLCQGAFHTIPTRIDFLPQIFKPMKSIHLAMKILDQTIIAIKNHLGKHDVDVDQPDLFMSNLAKSGL